MNGKILPPGATIGILGGGQLGRMFAFAAKRLGYGVLVYSPEDDSPAAQVSDGLIQGAYTDVDALKRFGEQVDVVTLEFENIPVSAINALSAMLPVRPNGDVLHTTQNRLREKRFLQGAGFPVTSFCEVNSEAELTQACATLAGPIIVKTAEWGYDGKGQRTVMDASESASAWSALAASDGARRACIAERRIDLLGEASCIVARGIAGDVQLVGVFGNTHTNHILDTTLFPAPLAPELLKRIEEISEAIAQALGYVGVLCVEFFIDSAGGVMVNELAPRPHNSGHVTIEASVCSQFEQQVRAVCGLPLGSSRMVSPGAMVNLLGDLWCAGEPQWEKLSAFPEAHLHLYGKSDARPGRKMGHLTVLGASAVDAARYAREARQAIFCS